MLDDFDELESEFNGVWSVTPESQVGVAGF